MAINLRQLAKLLNLSPTTVSRALAGYSDVSDGTRLRVREIAKKHKYFPDFLVTLQTQNGIETQLVEIKPYRQLFKPKESGKRYLTEMKTWTKNQAKWEASVKFCTRRNWKFQIITEKEMGL